MVPCTGSNLVYILLEHRTRTGNGYITTAVLREILKELDDKITNEDLDMMIEEIDSDGSGTVDFDGKCCSLLSRYDSGSLSNGNVSFLYGT